MSFPDNLQPVRQLFFNLIDSWLSQFFPASQPEISHRLQLLGWAVAAAVVLWMGNLLILRMWAYLDRKTYSPEVYRAQTKPGSGIIVVVHGWTVGPASMHEIAEVAAALPQYKDFGIFLWAYDAQRLSNASPEGLSSKLCQWIDTVFESSNGEVILIGHSLGGLLVRQAYLESLQENTAWSAAVSRIILLAAPNRGTRAVNRSFWLAISDLSARSAGVGKLIQGVYRGSPFVVNLRIEWIRRFQSLHNPPMVAQLIGERDTQVAVDDSSDVLQFPSSLQRKLPDSTHQSILKKEESGGYLKELLTKSVEAGTLSANGTTAQPGPKLKILIAHGIRDYGGRFGEIADQIEAFGDTIAQKTTAMAPRYKYFSAFQFLTPWSRRNKMYDFADLYTELLAQSPVDAPISFFGHSFGTYLMLKSTDVYQAMTFDRVYLAGSVMAEDFFQNRNILGSRVQYLRNDIAAYDWPVGILCKAMNGLRLADDIGTGGFNGFTMISQPRLYTYMEYYLGDHGSALEADNRPNIFAWLFDGRGATFEYDHVKIALTKEKILGERTGLWDLASRSAPSLVLLLLAAIVYLLLAGKQPLVAAAEVTVIAWLLNII